MKVIVATVQVPFISGGAEVHAEGLRDALRRAGHQAEIVAVPFRWYPPEKILDHMLACRLLDLEEVAGMSIDRLIGLKFPAYLIPHPRKVLWILHQHRTAYEQWDHPLGDLIRQPSGAMVRDAICRADTALIPEARAVFANSRNVAARLKKYCGLDSEPLYHPPRNAERFHCESAEPFFFFPSRLWPNKRQALVIDALAHTANPVRVELAGSADNPEYEKELRKRAKDRGVEDRAVFLGQVSEDTKRERYARSLAVIYPPYDEDYGYVTLEAMLSSKAVVTPRDSGGPLEFVRDEENGLVTEPEPEPLARALDRLWENRGLARDFGAAGREHYSQLGISWDNVVARLLA